MAVATKPELPEAPSFVAPVKVPKIQMGQDARVALARDRVALLNANARLVATVRWYHSLVEAYR